MLKIGIDARCFMEGKTTGVEEYTNNLLENLFKLDTINSYILFSNSWKEYTYCFDWALRFPNVKLNMFRYPNKLLNFFFWYISWPKIDQLIKEVDVFIMPNIGFSSFTRKVKLILTVHDLSFERYPETLSWKRRLWHFFLNPKKLCHRADKIIVPSESTKNDLISLYRIKREKIIHLPWGISEKFKPIDRNNVELIKVKEKYQLPYKFILYFGTLEPRKNIIGIIRAYNQLQEFARVNKWEELKRYKLVIAGERGWKNQTIINELKYSPFNEKIMICESIPESEKVYFYNLSSLFVFPSRFEGFGFPPLEAMACGVPVIASNNSSLPEIIGDAGIMIDPDKPDEIFEAMKQILLDKDLYNKLRDKGLQQAKNFNWEKTTKEFIKILNTLKTK